VLVKGLGLLAEEAEEGLGDQGEAVDSLLTAGFEERGETSGKDLHRGLRPESAFRPSFLPPTQRNFRKTDSRHMRQHW